MKKTIHKVTIARIPDPHADSSYLEQDEFKERYEQYKNGQFGFIGIVAKAEITVPATGRCSIIQTVRSGGLWGIEDDSSEDYLTSVAAEELAELKNQLYQLGFSKHAVGEAFHSVRL